MNRPGLRIPLVLVIGFLLTGGCAALFLFALDSIVYWQNVRKGNRVASEIDRYRAQKGHLPLSLGEIGEPDSESGPIYYQQCSETHYLLWFGTTLGHSMSFDSANRSWVSLNIVCPEKK